MISQRQALVPLCGLRYSGPERQLSTTSGHSYVSGQMAANDKTDRSLGTRRSAIRRTFVGVQRQDRMFLRSPFVQVASARRAMPRCTRSSADSNEKPADYVALPDHVRAMMRHLQREHPHAHAAVENRSTEPTFRGDAPEANMMAPLCVFPIGLLKRGILEMSRRYGLLTGSLRAGAVEQYATRNLHRTIAPHCASRTNLRAGRPMQVLRGAPGRRLTGSTGLACAAQYNTNPSMS